jgi:2-polyprenyl-3-methyl-5-hydroxy-6-metoxy-1,4-benzoquinol methylase
MGDSKELRSYLEASPYFEPVDLKKLRFIYSAIGRHAGRTGRQKKELNVLEVACGEGGITLAVASLGCSVKAFDIDEQDVSALRAEIESRGHGNVTVTAADALEFDDGEKYDVVIASEIIEHVLDPARLAAALKNSTSPGGIIILTTPNGFGPWELKNALSPYRWARRWNWLRRRLGKEGYVRGTAKDHCQRFSKRNLIDMFSELSMNMIDFAKTDGIISIVRPLRRSSFWGGVDTRMADVLPYWLSSGFFLVFENGGGERNEKPIHAEVNR